MKLSELSPGEIGKIKEELKALEAKKDKEASVIVREDNVSRKESRKVCDFCGTLLSEGQLLCNYC